MGSSSVRDSINEKKAQNLIGSVAWLLTDTDQKSTGYILDSAAKETIALITPGVFQEALVAAVSKMQVLPSLAKQENSLHFHDMLLYAGEVAIKYPHAWESLVSAINNQELADTLRAHAQEYRASINGAENGSVILDLDNRIAAIIKSAAAKGPGRPPGGPPVGSTSNGAAYG